MGRGVRRAAASVLFVLAALSVIYIAYRYAGPGPLEVPVTVVIPKGAGVTEIAGLLATSHVLAMPWLFRVAVRLQDVDASLRAGEYRFAVHESMHSVIARLREGDVVVRRLTVPEGMSSGQVVALLRQTEELEGEIVATPPEGTLLPETYTYTLGDTRNELLRRMASAMTAALDEAWAAREPGLPLKTPRDAVILASIVEKETALAAERPRVAAVFLNRLQQGMRLQADPTVAYAVNGGDPSERPLTLTDLQYASPYNTYVTDGLPPGPIANPGRASLVAVLHPMHSDELYFVADGTGGHAFARTLQEHQRNVARWRKRNGD